MSQPAPDPGTHPPQQQQQQPPRAELLAASHAALREAQNWIEAVTGRRFGDKDFRGALENGILLCELLSSIRPGLVKKINRLPTPIAGLDNLTLFLRGCEELGVKGSQLFDPGDLQDSSTRTNLKCSDGIRKLKNVLITIYWLGKAANSCTSYSGPTLDLKEFEGLLSQMRKAEDPESPKRSVRDSGYVDSWDSERSDSLSSPRHGRDDSFDSLDSFGSRSLQTPSPDVVFRGSSDGRGSDSESDAPQRRLPDLRKDDMLARRTSCSELRVAVPFNQYLPNRSNQSSYVPGSQRRRRTEREEGRGSCGSASSPVGAERPFRSMSMIDVRSDEEVFLQPHSQVRHELMHNQYNRLREEESHWQDDLARWKSRRRSISQDLIKKEEERKMMEQLMTGESSISQRRRSIKTYREIVEDKERRERELHDAYQRARTPEEAVAVLQRYAQRFTISEAVLEQLHLPRVLERSMSADPSGLGKDPNPLRYLRQQSLPVPKFTSTLEAMVSGVPKSQQGPSPASRSPPRSLSSQGAEPRSVQVDGVVQVNGDQRERLSKEHKNRTSPPTFQPSPTAPEVSRKTARALPSRTQPPQNEPELERAETLLEQAGDHAMRDIPPAEESSKSEPLFFAAPLQDESRTRPDQEPTPTRPTSLLTLRSNGVEQDEAPDVRSGLQESSGGAEAAPVTSVNTDHQSGEEPAGSDVDSVSTDRQRVTAEGVPTDLAHHRHGDKPPVATEISHVTLDLAHRAGSHSPSTLTMDGLKSGSFHKQYRHQQEKLKREWDRAQREVEEEERRFHEQERRILEETVTPLTPRSSCLTSPGCGDPGLAIVRSLADWERKQELLERRTKGKERGAENEDEATDRSSRDPLAEHKRAKEDYIKATEITRIRSCGQISAKQNGRRDPADAGQGKAARPQHPQGTSCDSRKCSNGHLQEEVRLKTASLDRSWSCRHEPSGGTKRAASCENVGTNSPKSSSSSSSCPSDVQPPSPSRSVSGKKLCSSCGHPLGRGAAMIIETLSLYFHMSCFKCGVCRGQLGDTSTGTDVRIRNGLLNCQQCYIKSRVAGQPTTL
ncbi:LIM and calponin homology domains-containing protein 1-like isoform X2 [Scleropages formosus]|uniref:LIM and calponin homology domains-containing protein 1-like isoform X2 n=1 Tax=Scleropages formosus TaxID=113540 RepID=UPI0010FA8561|nr:LIM and calponin homology domains-containing protein 1-like isoform X2 [Scleropages formosus]